MKNEKYDKDSGRVPRAPTAINPTAEIPPDKPAESGRNNEAGNTSIEAHRKFWSQIATKYDGVMDLVVGAKARAEVLARFTRTRDLGRVIEFGCGTGFNTRALAANATAVVATDISPGMLAVAQRNVRAENVTFQVADCRRPPFDSKAFDTAVLSLVLHFADPEVTLQQMQRIVRPGGRIFIINPGLESMGSLVRFGCQCRMIFFGITRYRLKPPRGFSKHLLSGWELCDLLEWTGWSGVRSETIPSCSRPFGLPLEYIEAVRKPGFRST